ncbi:MATE efflux family protein [Coccomyxa subellipsoidea C-169]|uniref:Protein DETOXIFICATION n=1 Tax=Coccomyxa subellipsoidea (strain C-169) TaxID=574566 RepID=I0ZAD7_COCSC|nr:MATE efflux family protein [Coccomyxa subellipsoidea C-169]EIE27606.1 MATE efflux family protein [Coccomyxa subellipsoidea C-169]|eukprot:XP_005652150.1 MATE efflux family protein [Coccomyxa subellipsoidea C-169]
MSSSSPFQRGTEQDAELGVPLLEDEHYDETSWPSFPDIWQEILKQSKLALPLGVNLIVNYSITTISLTFNSHLGTQAVAAASLASATYWMFGKLLVQSLCGALDTRASQAYGSGAYDAIGVIFQRCVLFMLAHCIPITFVQLAVPELLKLAGEDAELCRLASAYALRLLPSLYLEALSRPLNRVLIAQRIAAPQMAISMVVAGVHVFANIFFIHTLGFGFLGAAYAICLASLNNTLLTAGYIIVAGMQDRVWGQPTWDAFKRWGEFARLAYSSCFMKVAESWAFGMIVLLAGLMPDPDRSVASASITFNAYGITYMVFLAQSIAVSTRVGNELGAGRPRAARTAAAAGVTVTPLLWAVIAVILAEPHLQRLVLLLYLDGSDPVLWRSLSRLLLIVAVVELFDGLQTTLGGVVQGSGKQQRGALINVVAFYIFALPLAAFLGFYCQWDVTGLFAGMGMGPFVQSILYGLLVLRLDWKKESNKAAELAGREEAEVLIRRLSESMSAAERLLTNGSLDNMQVGCVNVAAARVLQSSPGEWRESSSEQGQS